MNTQQDATPKGKNGREVSCTSETKTRAYFCNATSRKVAGSNSDEVLGLSFNFSNIFCSIMTLGLTQLLTGISTKNLPGVQSTAGA
jgi:hypothetical protein